METATQLVFGWRTALLLVVALQLIAAAGLLAARPSERLSSRVLAAFLLSLVLALTPQIIGFAGFYDAFPRLQFAPFDVTLLYGPLIYAYAGALMLGRLPRPRIWLFAPGAAQFAYYSVLFMLSYDAKLSWRDTVHRPFVQPVEDALTLAFGAAALIASFRLHRRYVSWLERRSSAKAAYDARWFWWFLAAMSGLFGLAAVFEAWALIASGLSYRQGYWLWLAVAAVSLALAVAALLQPRSDSPKMTPAPADAEPVPAGRDWAEEARVLRARMLEAAWHLEPELSLPELARRLGTNETYLSRTINQGAGENFNTFVNRLRVAAAQKTLAAPDGGDILSIAYACGFNSKATFNRVFRELTGSTPSAFRRTSQNQ